MAEYDVRFSKERQKRGLPCYAVMKLAAVSGDGDFWMGLSAHRTEEEAQAALSVLVGQQKHICPRDDNGSALIGCGHEFEQEPDHEGWVDCPECGMAFDAVRARSEQIAA